MLVRNPEEEKKEKEKVIRQELIWNAMFSKNVINRCGQVKKPFKDSKASWYDDFVRNRKIITVHLHILHPAIRYCHRMNNDFGTLCLMVIVVFASF